MPLNCDCYPGCWALHSVDWPTIIPEKIGLSLEVVEKIVRANATRGTYVFVSAHVRVETEKLKTKLESLMNQNTPTPQQQSVLQDWVMKLPLRHQGTLLTAVRGCDDEPKTWNRVGVAYSPGRRLTAFIRWCFMNSADPREVDAEEGAFFMSKPPSPFKPSEFGHLPQHWYSHAMHALEVVAYCHPDPIVGVMATELYSKMVHNLHLNTESPSQMRNRLTEDRIAKGTVVS